jgi:hypothetical protein
MTNKTLADLLREDGAVEGDVYEACGQKWVLDSTGELITVYGKVMMLSNGHRHNIPADGWKRVSPREPLRVEFEATFSQIDPVPKPSLHIGLYTSAERNALRPFWGKRVKVTVEEVEE